MIDVSFTYADLEFFLLILVRVTCFIHVAPLFGMNGTVPRRVKVALSVFIAYFLFFYLDHNEVVYDTVSGYAMVVMKEAVTGFLIGWGAQLCMTVANFAGRISDMEIGLSMVNLMDPLTRENATFSGVFYQYMFSLFMLITGMYEYLLKALMDTFTLIPVNGAVFQTEALIDSLVRFMSDYIIIGFRICLPIFCVMLLLNCVLGILAKIAPQMNMFSVGIQMKVLTGLSIMFLTVRMLPGAADFVFREMKELMHVFVRGMMG